LPPGGVGIDPGALYLASNRSEHAARDCPIGRRASADARDCPGAISITGSYAYPFASARADAPTEDIARAISRPIPDARPVTASRQ